MACFSLSSRRLVVDSFTVWDWRHLGRANSKKQPLHSRSRHFAWYHLLNPWKWRDIHSSLPLHPSHPIREMDISDIAKKLGLSDSKHIIRKAAELRRLCDIQFDSSVIGVVSFPNLHSFIHIRFTHKKNKKKKNHQRWVLMEKFSHFLGGDLQGHNLLRNRRFKVISILSKSLLDWSIQSQFFGLLISDVGIDGKKSFLIARAR